MKKIIFIIISTIVLTSCGLTGGGRSRNGNQPLVPSCDTGYAADNGKCIPMLATPSISTTSMMIGATSTSFKLNVVKDALGNVVSDGSIHYVSIATPSLGCANVADPTCNSGTVYVAGTALSYTGTLTTVSYYCLKAISCADEYKDSEIFIKTITVGASSNGNGNPDSD